MTPLSYPDILSGPSASVLTKSLGRETHAIIVYTVGSMLDGTLLSHFKQPVTVYTPSPAERKDRDVSGPPVRTSCPKKEDPKENTQNVKDKG